jgi:hypothetical protein
MNTNTTNVESVKRFYKKNPHIKRLENKKNKVRNVLRKYNLLPPVGEPLNDEQKRIWDEISNGDFSFYLEFKEERKSNSLKKRRVHSEEEKLIIKREQLLTHSRKYGILPELGESMNEDQVKVYDFILQNYNTPIKSFLSSFAHLSTPEHRIWYRARKSSWKKEYTHEFNIEVSDIVIPNKCPYLDIELSTNYNDHDKPNYYSIDRIDSSKGYVKGNIQVISRLANTMKNGATIEQLKVFSENVLKLHSQKI